MAGAPDGGPAATRRGPLPQVSRRLPRRAAPTLIRRSRRTPPGSRRLWSATREIRAQTPSESQGVAAKGDGSHGPRRPDTVSDYRPAAAGASWRRTCPAEAGTSRRCPCSKFPGARRLSGCRGDGSGRCPTRSSLVLGDFRDAVWRAGVDPITSSRWARRRRRDRAGVASRRM